MTTVAWLPGDGVGHEVTEGAVEILRDFVPEVTVTGPWPVGATGFSATGELLPAETMSACEQADVILLGAVGEDPDVPHELCPRPELSLLGLRRALDLSISVREVLDPRSSTSTVVVRNLLGGAYLPDDTRQESDGVRPAIDQLILEPERVAGVAQLACEYAATMPDRRFMSVDKASVYATSRLWRRVVTEVAEQNGLEVDHVYIDRAAFELASPRPLPGVLLTEGLFGDILSDLISGRAGSPALCGSASLSVERTSGCHGLFEPAHGSAPQRARQDRVNPVGGLLALVMLLDDLAATAPSSEQPTMRRAAAALRRGLSEVLTHGPFTYDLAPDGRGVGTRAVVDAVHQRALAHRDAPEERA